MEKQVRNVWVAIVVALGLSSGVLGASINYVADNGGGEYCGSGYGISISVSAPASGSVVKYSESSEGPWLDSLLYTNACAAKPMYFKISADDYTTVVDSRTVTITPKTLTGDFVWLVLPPTDYVYDGTAKTPDVACGDGDPSIITTGDFDVSFDNNVNAGTATATFTGKGNYTGAATEDFEIKRRVVTLTSADGNWTYDGIAHSNATVKAAGFVDGEGVTTNGFATITDVGSVPNAFGYDFAGGTLAANYNVSCVTGTLIVTKATINPGGGGGEPEEPGSGTVPVGGNSKFDASAMYDGEGHTIDTNALAAAFAAAIIGDATVEYALDNGSDAPVLPWGATTPAFTNAGEYVVWYCVTNSNYDDFVHKAKVTITQRDIANATIAPIADIVYAGVAAEPVPVVTDGDPSIIAATDYTVSYTENNAPGTATVVLTGQGNYTGTASATFEILSPVKDVVLDALDGKIGAASVVTQACTAVYGALPAATRENYTFDGWFLGVTNGAPQATSGGALLVDEDHVLFAKWSVDEASIPGGVAPTYNVEAIDGSTCRVTGLGGGTGMTGTKLVIPDFIGGLAVTEIAVGAFANLKNGLAEVILPAFCTNIRDKAFLSISTLTSVTFADVRQCDNPSMPAAVSIGAYAFAGTALATVSLPECVTAIGDYAFANCQMLSSMTILGHPVIGQMPFRRSGYGTASGVEVHLDPALAGDDDFMAALKQQCEKVTVRTDAVVTGVAMASLSMSPKKVKLTVSVERASSWGDVDADSVRVNYSAKLGDTPVSLVPDSVTENPDGSLTVEVVSPEGQSGFFQTTVGR